MGFSAFQGNDEVVARLRRSLQAGRLPHALILSGPEGSGKYLLATMLAKTMNCEAAEIAARALLPPPPPPTPKPAPVKKQKSEKPPAPMAMSLFGDLEPEPDEETEEMEAEAEVYTGPPPTFVNAAPPVEAYVPNPDGLPDFCGVCPSCLQIGQADDFAARFAEAVEAREGLKDSEKKETRILLQPHANLIIVPPDPPQMMIKVDQIRRVIESVRFVPERGRRVYILTTSAFIKEAANSLLKVLEEPPQHATLILLTENASELLPTIRSRCVTLTLAPIPVAELEADLVSSRPEWDARQRGLVARLAHGAIGRARSFDLATYVTARADALTILRSVTSDDHSQLFQTTERFRAGADGREKTDQLMAALYSLLEDLLFLQHGAVQRIRNTDIQADLKRLAAATSFAWLERAAIGLGEVRRGMRRNLLRSLSLDAFAAALE